MRTPRLGANGPDISVIGLGAWEAGGDVWGANPDDDDIVRAYACRVRRGHDLDRHRRGLRQGGLGADRRASAIAGRRDQRPRGHEARPRVRGLGVPARAGPCRMRGLAGAPRHRRDRPVPVALAGRVGRSDRGHVGRHGRARSPARCASLGVSNFDQGLLERCEAIRHVDSLQQEFSMLALDDRDLIRWCGEQGTGVVTYCPLGFGLPDRPIYTARERRIDRRTGAARRGRPVHRRELGPRSSRSSRASDRSPSGSTSRWRSSRWPGTSPNRASPRRSPAAAAGSTRARTPRRETSSSMRQTLREMEELLTG